MWAFYKGKRERAYNLDLFETITLDDDQILLFRQDVDSPCIPLVYEDSATAKKAFEHFLKSIKSEERLINL